MAADPFANVPVEDEQKSVGTAYIDVKPNINPEDWKNVPDREAVVVTLKGGSGYDAPWIVLRAGTVEEMNSVLNTELSALMERVSKAGQHFSGLAPQKSTSQSTPARREEPSDIPGSHLAQKPGDGWEYKTAVKNGKPWWGWFPPRGSDPSVKPKFLQKP
jgi:hypothetical protein